jgi:hypothetical protein
MAMAVAMKLLPKQALLRLLSLCLPVTAPWQMLTRAAGWLRTPSRQSV